MYVADSLHIHPKMLKAAAMLGGNGRLPEVFTAYVAALGYAHQHLTDGWVPADFILHLPGVKRASAVMKALTSPKVKLWHPAPGGIQIHDYLDHNDAAVNLRARRTAHRARMAKWRAKQKNGDA